MNKSGILNRDISCVISRIGHLDELIICDAGFPIPNSVTAVDISLAVNKPRVTEVLKELLKYFSVEKIIIALETREVSPTMFKNIINIFNKNIEVETISHMELKQKSKSVKAIIRTGDFTAYTNVLLVSGAGNRWYVEKG